MKAITQTMSLEKYNDKDHLIWIKNMMKRIFRDEFRSEGTFVEEKDKGEMRISLVK